VKPAEDPAMKKASFAVAACAALWCVAGCGSTARNEEVASAALVGFGPPGGPPAGWTAGETDGVGRPARWVVETDPTAPLGGGVMTCRTDNVEATFNYCVHDANFPADVEASVSLKAISGVDDRGGGLVFRFQDGANYYLTRWNPLEENVRLYHVKNGVRRIIGDAQVEVPADGWKTLGVKAVGDKLTVRFGGRTVIETTDGTFKTGGKVGLWTKADATTSFAAFAAKSD
jgi:hypothetical protein